MDMLLYQSVFSPVSKNEANGLTVSRGWSSATEKAERSGGSGLRHTVAPSADFRGVGRDAQCKFFLCNPSSFSAQSSSLSVFG